MQDARATPPGARRRAASRRPAAPRCGAAAGGGRRVCSAGAGGGAGGGGGGSRTGGGGRRSGRGAAAAVGGRAETLVGRAPDESVERAGRGDRRPMIADHALGDPSAVARARARRGSAIREPRPRRPRPLRFRPAADRPAPSAVARRRRHAPAAERLTRGGKIFRVERGARDRHLAFRIERRDPRQRPGACELVAARNRRGAPSYRRPQDRDAAFRDRRSRGSSTPCDNRRCAASRLPASAAAGTRPGASASASCASASAPLGSRSARLLRDGGLEHRAPAVGGRLVEQLCAPRWIRRCRARPPSRCAPRDRRAPPARPRAARRV